MSQAEADEAEREPPSEHARGAGWDISAGMVGAESLCSPEGWASGIPDSNGPSLRGPCFVLAGSEKPGSTPLCAIYFERNNKSTLSGAFD
jgi:hypothetical protein